MTPDGKPLTRGATSTLDLFGVTRKGQLDFSYKGKDLRDQSITGAVEEAWTAMGSLMSEFLDREPDFKY